MADRDPIVVLSNELIEAGELTADDWEATKTALLDRAVYCLGGIVARDAPWLQSTCC